MNSKVMEAYYIFFSIGGFRRGRQTILEEIACVLMCK
jgi:hypothetical protein